MTDALYRNDRRIRNNARYLSLYLFQYSFLTPLMALVNSTVLVAAISALLLVLSFLNNKALKMNLKIFSLIGVILLLLLLKVLTQPETSYAVFVYFLSIGCAGLYISSQPFDRLEFIHFGHILAGICFPILFWIPFAARFYSYMRFGYSMVVCSILLYDAVRRNSFQNSLVKILYYLMLIFSLVEIIFFGSRGCILCFAIYFAVDQTLIRRMTLKLAILLVAGIILVYNATSILNYLIDLLNSMGVRSYSLIKARMMLNKGLMTASSGRDELYAQAIQNIKNHPFWGNPIISGIVDDVYVHNLFLQMGVDFGIFSIPVLGIFLLACVVRFAKRMYSPDEKMIHNLFFSLSIGRLMFSSNYWRRPEFWLLIGFFLSMKSNDLP